MIECYYRWCKWHPVVEPFCSFRDCIASRKELTLFEKLRKEEKNAIQSNFRKRHDQLRRDLEGGQDVVERAGRGIDATS
jgi:hypothetical protein